MLNYNHKNMAISGLTKEQHDQRKVVVINKPLNDKLMYTETIFYLFNTLK